MYQLDFVCINGSDQQLLDAQLKKMVVEHMMAGDFKFASDISFLTTSLFRFRLSATNTAICMSRALAKTLTDEQKNLLIDHHDSCVDTAILNDIISNIVNSLIINNCNTWKLTAYRLEQLKDFMFTLTRTDELLGYDLFDREMIDRIYDIIIARQMEVERFIEEENQKTI